MTRSSPGLHPAWLVTGTSLWLAVLCNAPLWQALWQLPELDNPRGLGFGLAFALMIAATLTALLSLLNWRWTLKPVLSLCLLAAGFGAHFMLAYGVVIDTPMMVNVLQTDPRETRDLLNGQLVATAAGLGVLPMLLLWLLPVRRLGLGRRLLGNLLGFVAGSLVLASALLLVFQDFASVMRNHTQLRYLINPLNSFYALADLAAEPLTGTRRPLAPLGRDAQLQPRPASDSRPPLLVLVLGETARSGNFGINGYERPTTPRLLAAQEQLVSLRNAWSCGTSTAASVPCMFSHLGREGYEARDSDHETLLDVLQHAGLAVLWLDNQSGCKGVCARVPSVDTSQAHAPGLCDGGECFDEVMLRGLDERIAELPAERRARGVVLVMHQMGSHGPAYYKRSPAAFKRYLPECTSNALQDCSREQVVNAYDNSIAYTDHFLGEVIDWLQARSSTHGTALVYVSDHGESLGENNLYLHGLPYRIAPDVQKRVPWVTWLSPAFAQQAGLDLACLRRAADAQVSHDHYFHSVLGLLGVQTTAYQRPLDLYASCRSAPPR